VQRRKLHSDFSNCGEEQLAKAKKLSRLEANNRLSLLWSRHAPKLALSGVKVSTVDAAEAGISIPDSHTDDYIFTDNPTDTAKALKFVWSKAFNGSTFDQDAADEFLADYGAVIHWDWGKATPPSRNSIRNFIRRLKNSAPGLDGLPYAAWANGGEASLDYIIALLNQMLAGRPSPSEVNFGLFVFIPKSQDGAQLVNGRMVVTTGATDLRPLTLKNSDNKIVAGVVNHAITPVIKHHALKIQRGFVNGRQMVQNSVELDHDMRRNALEHHSTGSSAARELGRYRVSGRLFSDLPIGILFDFASAFPSVFQEWMLAVLLVIRVPSGILNFVRILYGNSMGFAEFGGLIVTLFQVTRGVLQGCPLSGSLFVIVMDPILFKFSKFVVSQGLGTVLACADDIGVSLRRARDLNILHEIFQLTEHVTGLALKPRKCVIILCAELDKNYDQCFSQWLTEYLPRWSHFTIRRFGKYLGFFLGPKGQEQMWIEPIKKFRDRAQKLAELEAGLSAVGPFFNSRATSVLLYVAQLALLPAGFKNIERGCLTKAFKMAPNSHSTCTAFSMNHWGGPNVLRPSYCCAAARFRAAVKGLERFREMHFELKRLALEAVPLKKFFEGDFSPPGWESPAFCTNLTNAYFGALGPDLIIAQENLLTLRNQFLNGSIKHGLQSKACQILHKYQPWEWDAQLQKRAELLCDPNDFGQSSPDWSEFHKEILQVSCKMGLAG
jgi:hypothetical protein